MCALILSLKYEQPQGRDYIQITFFFITGDREIRRASWLDGLLQLWLFSGKWQNDITIPPFMLLLLTSIPVAGILVDQVTLPI